MTTDISEMHEVTAEADLDCVTGGQCSCADSNKAYYQWGKTLGVINVLLAKYGYDLKLEV